MRLSRVLTELVAGVVDVLAPDGCHLCGAPAVGDATGRQMPSVTAEVLTPVRVQFCGVVLESHPICRDCVGALVPAERPSPIETNGPPLTVISPFYSNARLLEIIHLVKFRRYRHAVPGLAQAIARAIDRQKPPGADVLVPVPMDGRSRRRRGFNQAQLLAVELSRELDIPVEGSWLGKRRRTRVQSLVPAERRAENVRDAFVASGSIPQGVRVALVDDLVTSGATALACAGALSSAGACPVAVFAAGRTGAGSGASLGDPSSLRQS